MRNSTLIATIGAALVAGLLTFVLLAMLPAQAGPVAADAAPAALLGDEATAGQPLAVANTQAGAGPYLPVALTAYDAPRGSRLGEIEAGRTYAVQAEALGGRWLQLLVDGSGLVWVEAAAWGAHPIVRPAVVDDLTPLELLPTIETAAAPQVEYAVLATDPTTAPAAVELEAEPSELAVLTAESEQTLAAELTPLDEAQEGAVCVQPNLCSRSHEAGRAAGPPAGSVSEHVRQP